MTSSKGILTAVAIVIAALVLPAPAGAAGVRDGRIAFWDATSGQVYTINADSSGLTQLTHEPDGSSAGYPDWSQDGRRLVFNTFSATAFEGQDRIWTMNPDGSGQRMVLDDRGYQDDFPQFGPGDYIVFARCSADFETCGIAAMRADGSGLRMLTPLTTDQFDYYPDVSPSGEVVFSRFNAGGNTTQIYLIQPGGAQKVTADSFGARLPKWSPDGAQIVMESCCQLSRDVYTIAPNGTHLRRITHTPYPRSRRWPAYSATGTRLVYVGEKKSAQPYQTSDLFISSADGTHEMRLRTGLENPVAPSWGRATG